jgi:hypothetical protein
MEQTYLDMLTSAHHLGHVGDGFCGSLRIVDGDENFIDSFHGFARSSTNVLVPGFPTEARPSVEKCQQSAEGGGG